MTDHTFAEIAPLLYLPANRPELGAIMRGEKAVGVCALAICLEDAVRPGDRIAAARNLAAELALMPSRPPRPIFIRPADLEMLNRLLDSIPLHTVAGFILPKATSNSISEWSASLGGQLPLLPILESRQTLDPAGRRDLSQACAQHRANIPRVRIGANDLLSLLGGLRRPPGHTIYETPVGRIIDALIECFSLVGIPLCGSVFDRLDDLATLGRECIADQHRGLFAKTAVNPEQVKLIWQSSAPTSAEIEEATRILQPDCPAVFSLHGAMHEPACHAAWARQVIRRASIHANAAKLMVRG